MEQTGTRDFYVAARNYLTAVRLLASNSAEQTRLFLPMHNLMGFALELFLKAWLCHAGLTEDDLRYKPFGHDLRRLYAKAVETGIGTINGLEPLTEHLHEPHSTMEYRYIKPDSRFNVTNMAVALQVFDTLDARVLPVVPSI